jgi:hypothetical protein
VSPSLSEGYGHNCSKGNRVRINLQTLLMSSHTVRLGGSCFLSVLFDDAVSCWDYIASVIDDLVWSIGGMILTRQNWSTRYKTCPSATLSSTPPTWSAGNVESLPSNLKNRCVYYFNICEKGFLYLFLTLSFRPLFFFLILSPGSYIRDCSPWNCVRWGM